jgi:hypothetical protein
MRAWSLMALTAGLVLAADDPQDAVTRPKTSVSPWVERYSDNGEHVCSISVPTAVGSWFTWL